MTAPIWRISLAAIAIAIIGTVSVTAQELVTTPFDEVPQDQLIGQITPLPLFDENGAIIDDADTAGVPSDQADPSNTDVLTFTSEIRAPRPVTEAARAGDIADLRLVDRLTGAVSDLSLQTEETTTVGFLSIKMGACRFPQDNPSGDAFTHVLIRDVRQDVTLFSGWLIASAPALNAMDHPRYDIWALRCMTS